MINKIFIDQMFRHFGRTIEFDKGLTGIVGKNESGKSLIVEAIRFALFGSAALRGKADDYKKLHVELWFSIKGEDYHVTRKGTKVVLRRNGDDLASGTKPVNQAIVEILGYDLTVFDVANACNQGNVEALSNMRPGERKAMVDRTIGLNVLDDLIKHAGDQALLNKREAETVERMLVQPVEPVQPEGYSPSTDLVGELSLNRQLLAERNQLAGWLNATPPAPIEPPLCSVRETVAELEAYQRQRKAVMDLEADLQRRIKAVVLPKYPSDYLDQQAAQWVAYGLWQQKKRLLDQGHLCCPSCKHEWPIASEQLQALADVTEVDKPEISEATIKTERSLQGQQKLLDDLIEELHSVVVPSDRTIDLHQRRQYEAGVSQYEAQLKAYQTYMVEQPAKRARFNQLDYVEQLVGVLDGRLREAQAYERDVAVYQSAVVAYEKNAATAAEARRKADEFAEAKKRIADLKVRVKTHLLPSLNKVASILLNQMTGGERYLVEVDEDFEILIDGQPINTLSGSGKAVANLAVRIALGQILTNKVFSVFFADEVDAAMDDDRATYTAQALRRLTDLIGQVIIVTHKKVETDHLIELKK